jgi:hypothetical protein
MSKQVSKTQAPVSVGKTISLQDALVNLGQRLKLLEEQSNAQFKTIETKIGDHENKS